MLIVTSAYLGLEAAFNSHLVGRLSGMLTMEDVLALEQWGRILASSALALLILSPAVARFSSGRNGAAVVLLFAALLTRPVAYFAEMSLAARQAGRSGQEERRTYMRQDQFSRGMRGAGRGLTGIDDAYASTVPGRVFLAASPTLPMQDGGHLKEIVESNFRSDPDAAATRRAFLVRIEELRRRYRTEYVPSAHAFHEAIKTSDLEAGRAWNRFVDKVGMWVLTKYLQRYRRGINHELRQRFGPSATLLPRNWRLGDQKTFKRVVKSNICDRIVDHGELLRRVGEMDFDHRTGRGDGARHAGAPDRGDPGWRPRDSYWPPHADGADPEAVVRVKSRDFR